MDIDEFIVIYGRHPKSATELKAAAACRRMGEIYERRRRTAELRSHVERLKAELETVKEELRGAGVDIDDKRWVFREHDDAPTMCPISEACEVMGRLRG